MNAQRIDDTACIVDLPAELTDSDEGPLFEACVPVIKGKPNYVLLDFTAVKRMNGLGASMLVKLYIRCKRRGQRLLLCGVGEHYDAVLRLIGMEPITSVFRNRATATAFAGITDKADEAPAKAPAQAIDAANWAISAGPLEVPEMPPEAINMNMQGRRCVGPVDGFGQLWQKTYRLRVNKASITPAAIIAALKENFPGFQPDYNRFYPSPRGISPGEVVLIDSKTPGGTVSTGVMVLYADEWSFTFITPQGHPESGWVTFSASKDGNTTVAQILGLARASDPVYEAAFRVIGSNMQIKIWRHVLTSLAKHLKVPAEITVEPRRVDSGMQWGQAGNVWYNAQVRTLFGVPFRRLTARRNR